MGTEIQDFAATLRELKQRSGLSYGALAQRLHMSTSTVHRYCNGDAVPHDYAPVERFARVCRASADELVGLHRKWILADEAKRRGSRKPEGGEGAGAGEETAEAASGAAGGAGAAASSGLAASSGPAVEPGAGPETERGPGSPPAADPGAGGAPDAGGDAETGGEAETGAGVMAAPAGPAGPAGPGRAGETGKPEEKAARARNSSVPSWASAEGPGSTEGGGTAAPPRRPEARTDEVTAPDDVAPDGGAHDDRAHEDVTPGGGAPGAGRKRRTGRRTRVLLAAAAVVALTVPGALAVRGLTQDDGATADDGRDGKALGSSAPRTPGGPAASVSVSASPSRTESSPSATASASGTPSKTAGSPAAEKTGKARSTGTPVTAVISSYNWEAPCGQYYLLDRDPNDVVPPPPPQDTRTWAQRLGGVDGGDMMLEITVQGTSEEAVVLKALHVRVLGRNPALDWGAFSMGDGCGSGVTPQTFEIDLDDGRPRSKPVAGQQGDVVVPAKGFPYRVSSTDVEVFHIDAHVEAHDVTWYLELEWSSGGRSGILRIDDQGRPFRTSSITARPEYYYRPDTGQWVEKEY
ncbi:helix-turn-helix domain-containing protein [Streptomyces nitrosporeus]|uniref:helix-turn-helix domain-containing protein n=1 Tax=Streptomyces nitrosporeus TaxID=28894 RepID=UPI00331C42D8